MNQLVNQLDEKRPMQPDRQTAMLMRWSAPWTRRLALAMPLAVIAIALMGWGTLFLIDKRLGPPPLARAEQTSVTVLDRHDKLLRAFTTTDGRWRLPIELNDADPRYLDMLLAYEDRRYWQHRGVDPLAGLRAVGQLVLNGRVISGGSTLTMQVARLIDGDQGRSAARKLRQIARALSLERSLSKPDIMRIYLRLAPFGGNVEGVRAASLAYFGKEPKRLSLAESALLVALPQAPEVRRPDRHSEMARRARDRVLDRAVEAKVIAFAEAERAKREPVPTLRREFPKLAPHLAEAEVKRDPAARQHRLTIDRDLQSQLETLASDQVRALGSKLSAAILVADHRTGEILAHVGSAGYFDSPRLGAIDMTRAVRSPGSTLKPFIYGLAFEGGIAHPETLIEDRPVRYGSYHPKNFDEDYRGTVSMREALASSLNIPAVKVLAAVGPLRLLGRFRRLRLVTGLPSRSEPSLAIALGGIGLRLTDLATLYASLAHGGDAVRLTHRRADAARAQPADPSRRLLSPRASWYVADILKDAPPPANAKGGRIAYKTGTSYGYRDAWAAGFDGRYTVAVWIGRPDGAATPGLTGRAAAAPVLFDAFQRISAERVPLPPPPGGVIAGHDLPLPLRRFGGDVAQASETGSVDPPVAIAFPLDKSELDAEGETAGPVVLKAEGGTLPLTWLADGKAIASEPHRREAVFEPTGKGFARITVIDAKGRADRISVRIR